MTLFWINIEQWLTELIESFFMYFISVQWKNEYVLVDTIAAWYL